MEAFSEIKGKELLEIQNLIPSQLFNTIHGPVFKDYIYLSVIEYMFKLYRSGPDMECREMNVWDMYHASM